MDDADERSGAQTVLLVEDNPDDATLLAMHLSNEVDGGRFEVKHVQTVDAALALLWSTRIDIVLLDLALPDSFGMGTLEMIVGAAPTTPVVVLTGLADDEAAVQACALGAQDYIVKGAATADMTRALRQALARHHLERGDAEPTTAFRTTHDSLTGLPNRFLFMDRLNNAVARARRYRDPLGLLTLRLWAAGESNSGDWSREAVAAEMARRLRSRTRRSDTLARIEPDMFAVILERAQDKEAVRQHLGGLVKALEAPVPWSGSRISFRIQPGLAFCPQDAGDTESLLQVAVADGGELSA